MERFFKFDNGYEPATYRFFEDSETEIEYNMFGYYRIDNDFHDNLNNYRDKRNNAFAYFVEQSENYTLSNVKEFIEEFIDDYEYETSFYTNETGRPKELVLFEDNEDYMFSDYSDFYNEDGTAVSEADLPCSEAEFVKEWDGHNWKKIYLIAYFETFCEEVTDDFGDKENWVEINSSRSNTGYSTTYYDKETDSVFVYSWSAYQGVSDGYMLVSGDERTVKITEAIYENDNENIPRNLIDEVISEFDLKQNEIVKIDNSVLCFIYRNEKYHFEKDEVIEYNSYNLEYPCQSTLFDNAIETAREAIEIRRIERVTERFAKNNYALVDTLPLQHIFVEYEDSIKAGNCKEESKQLRKEIAKKEKIQGLFACRADVLLSYRKDNYSKRAVLSAYRRHYC